MSDSAAPETLLAGDVTNEIFDLVQESNRRCNELRVKLIKGDVSDDHAARAYATATAPLASAARRIRELRVQPPEVEEVQAIMRESQSLGALERYDTRPASADRGCLKDLG